MPKIIFSIVSRYVLLVFAAGLVATSEPVQSAQMVAATTDGVQPVQIDRGWTKSNDDPNHPRRMVKAKNLILHPAPEPRPALKYQLIPSDFKLNDGNAAIHYLRAMGFLSRSDFISEITRLQRVASKEAEKTGVSSEDLPPFVWQRMSPEQLPLDEVKKYLNLTQFQVADLEAARHIRSLDFHRNLRQVESPFSITLDEVQPMRDVARQQSIRCRVAIAEGRFDDGFAIYGQQLAMARHLSQDPLLISLLVSSAIAEIAWSDALDLVQMPNAPNLFWAVGSLPKPLISARGSFSAEREMVFLELKALQEVDEQPRPVSFWNSFIDRSLPQLNRLISMVGNFGTNELSRFDLISLIAAGYPGAKDYLIEFEGMDATRVESLPMAQVFFLAQKKYCEYVLDEQYKVGFLDFQQLIANREAQSENDRRLHRESALIGWAAFPGEYFTPDLVPILSSFKRAETQLAILQTIEGIRMYAASHDGKLPPSLAELPFPVPVNPFTGKAVEYKVSGNTARLTAEAGNIVYVLNLKMAK